MLKRSLAVMAALTLFSLAACSDSDDKDDAKAGDPAASQTSDTPPSESPASGACTYNVDGSEAAKPVEPPPADATVEGMVNFTIETSAGDIPVTLDAGQTPCTVNSFVSLAEQDYFDDTECHRLTTDGIYVLQCGDPSASGMGGPGYQYDDELSGKETYPSGTLAMANAGPGTNGSQFFMVYKDSPLPAAYTVFGKIDTDGLKVVKAIADKGTDNGQSDGAPKKTVTIDEVSD